MLYAVFKLQFAPKCSWKSQQNNHKVSDLKVIQIMQGTLTQQFTIILSEY